MEKDGCFWLPVWSFVSFEPFSKERVFFFLFRVKINQSTLDRYHHEE